MKMPPRSRETVNIRSDLGSFHERREEHKDPPRYCPCESSWLRVFVVRFFYLRLGCSVFICGFVHSSGSVYAHRLALAEQDSSRRGDSLLFEAFQQST